MIANCEIDLRSAWAENPSILQALLEIHLIHLLIRSAYINSYAGSLDKLYLC